MLTNEDLFDEIASINKTAEKETGTYQKAMLKGMTLLLKLMHNIRSNQVTAMRAQGIKLMQPRVTANAETTKQ